MRVYRGLPNSSSRTPCALTVGNFDGVHRGHQALLAQVKAAADWLNLAAAVMTFEPHPREFFLPHTAPARIANQRDKLEALAENGIDRVIIEHFNARFARLTPQQFIQDILVDGCHVRWLIVGDDFRFGARRVGDLTLLREAGQEFGFEVVTLPTITDDAIPDSIHCGERISSSAIREALAAGDMDRAERLLGHHYFISGHVIYGQKLGRNIGFPTANISPFSKLSRHGKAGYKHAAVSGIFIVQVHGVSERPWPAVASIGVRPTVDDSGRILLETHLLDFDQNLYGKLIRVEFLKKLRDEEKYDDLETLTAAIARDAQQARQYFGLPQTN